MILGRGKTSPVLLEGEFWNPVKQYLCEACIKNSFWREKEYRVVLAIIRTFNIYNGARIVLG